MASLKKIAAGFGNDMQVLQKKFLAAETLRFKEFSRLWREMQFALILCGRKDVRESRLFVEEIFPMVLKLWHPTCTYPENVFGLYMLYALYATQPLWPKTKIRVRLTEWNHLEDLLARATKFRDLDVCYATHRMRLGRCFHFVASIKRRSPIMLDFEDVEASEQDLRLRQDVFSNVEKICADGGTLKALSATHQAYMELKSRQTDPSVRNLSMVKDNIFEGIIKEFTDLQAEYKVKQEKKPAITSTDESEEGFSSDDEHGASSRRRALRQQAYRTKSETHKERRSHQLLDELLDEESCSDSAKESVPPARNEAFPKRKSASSTSGASKSRIKKEPGSVRASVPSAVKEEGLSEPGTSASDAGKIKKKKEAASLEASLMPALEQAGQTSDLRADASGAGKSRKKRNSTIRKKKNSSSTETSVPRGVKQEGQGSKSGTSGAGSGKGRKKQRSGSAKASEPSATKRVGKKKKPEASAPAAVKIEEKQSE